MNRIITPLLAFLCLASLFGCQKRVVLEEQNVSEVESLVFSVDPFQSIDDSPISRTSVSDAHFYWAEGDTVGIYPNTGAQVYFAMTSGAGASTAQFDGGGWAFKPSSSYYSYYPFIGNIYLNRNHIPVSYLHQKQIGTTATSHIGPFDFMFTDESSTETTQVNFQYHHLGCIIRLILVGLPAGNYTKLAVTAPSALFPTKGYYDLMAAEPVIVPAEWSTQAVIDLEDFSIQNGTTYYVYLMSAPAEVGNVPLIVSILNEQKTEYQCNKTPGSNFLAGQNRGLTCNSFTAVPQSMGLIMEDWGNGGSISGDAN